jgi:BolA protein
MTTIKRKIEEKLKITFNPSFLEVIDESKKHKGHLEKPFHAETHFRITLVSDQFRALPRIKRHQQVYKALEEEVGLIHALSLDLKDTKEYALCGPSGFTKNH